METNDIRSLIEQARDLLSQEQPDLTLAAWLAKQLRHEGKFAYAAELYLMLLEQGATKENRDDYLDKLVHCLYKDPDLPSSTKFDFAIRYLGELDVLKNTRNPEVLGRMGAIYKNKWQYDNQYRNLLFSRHYYQRGYLNWHRQFLQPEKKDAAAGKERTFVVATRRNEKDEIVYEHEDRDAGYTAINFAFILELMANTRLGLTAVLAEAISENVLEQMDMAKRVREEIIAYFGITRQQEIDENAWPEWMYATVAEACFGLGRFDEAKKYYQLYGKKNPGRWQIDTTAKQLTALAQVLIQLVDFRSQQKKRKYDADLYDTARINNAACDCLTILYSSCMKGKSGRSAGQELPDIALRGKVGLALSGGGFRAALFHIGVLARLAELNVLRHVEVLSCVSGGSIVGAYYYLLLKRRLEEKDDRLDRQDYIEIVETLTRKFLTAVQRNIRTLILKDFRKNMRVFFDRDYTRTHRLGELYEDVLYKDLVADPENDLLMHHLRIRPGGDETFDIKIENWNRKNKVPMLVLNATALNTGHNWQFTASWMGEPPGSIQQEVDSKPRLRRMYYQDAPEKYREKIRLGMAVGASSCVPALFEPLLLRDLYPDIDLMLVDGGVQDNQGVSSLLEQECKVLIVSDSSGQLPNEATLDAGALHSFFRSDLVLQEKVREHQMTDLFKREESAQLSGLFYLHLKKDLHSNPVKWKFSKEPTRKIWLKLGFADNVNLTSYDTLKRVQERLAELRTDLDAFSDAEAYALMYSGYCQARAEFERPEFKTLFSADTGRFDRQKAKFEASKNTADDPGAEKADNPEHRWDFFKITPWMTEPERSENLIKRLKIGKLVPFKVFRISWKARLLALVPLAFTLAAIIALIWFFAPQEITFKVTMQAVGFTLLIYMLGYFVSSTAARLMNYKSFLLRPLFMLLGALFIAWLSQAYIKWLNHRFLDWGKIDQLDREDDQWLKRLKRFWGYLK
ncbi:MAG: hypothetical protein DYG98_26845 [Haliscomenobacteraceae bacterium CHB4]|nr:hypothetical protein [Saprospiraceae bacterium]MCE7926675.1 hypothetical protein [Haliscomenobacteraceae bacterium CHB4]